MERKFSKTILKIATAFIVLMLCVLLVLGIGISQKQDKYQATYESYDENNIVASELYTVEDSYLSRILPETTLRDLKNNLDNQQISVYKKDGSELQDTELVGTGMSLEIGNKRYKLSVIGDINGSGKIGITDLTQMNLALIGKKEKPQNEYAKSADINNNGKLTITDVTRENLALIGIVDLIAPNTFVPEVVSTKDTITVLGETSDTNSGIKEYWFEINNNGWISNKDKSNNKYTFTGLNMETKYTIRMKVVDNSGNTKITKRVTIETLNEENANISIVASTTEWTNKNILVAVNFNSNVAKETKQISIDNGKTWVEYTEPITVDKNMKIKARVVNSSGEVLEEQEKEITNIDKLVPNEFEISATSTTDSVTINIGTEQNSGTTDAQATNEYACSGIKEYKYTIIDGNWKWEETTTDVSYTFTNLTNGKTYTIKVVAIDNAGNETEEEQSIETIHASTVIIDPNGGSVEIKIGDTTETITEKTAYKKEANTILKLQSASKEPTIETTEYTVKFNTNGGNEIADAKPKQTITTEYTHYQGYWEKSEPFYGTLKIEVGYGDSYIFGEENEVTSTITATFDETPITGMETVTLPEPTKDGYNFIGWYSDSELTTKVGDAGDTYNPTETETTLYAKWEIDNIEYYGKEVTNYTCTASGVDTWRVFHIDDDNIYLIADDCIPNTNVPTSEWGVTFDMQGTYGACIDYEGLGYYTGSAWIRSYTNEKAQKWLKTYLNAYPDSINDNMKAVAYMMDTDTWSGFKGDMAEYAIGGPTLELFCASYKVTHPDKYIECDSVTSKGYQVKWNTDNLESYSDSVTGMPNWTVNEFNDIYTKYDRTDAMWISSPIECFSSYVAGSWYFGGVSGMNYFGTSTIGFRPIVCLKSGVNLINNGDDTYSIQSPTIDEEIEKIGKITITPSTLDWTNQDITIEVTYPEIVGYIKEISIDNGITWEKYTSTVKLSTNTTVKARLKDSKGQTSTPESLEITNIDKLAPKDFSITTTVATNSITVNAVTTDEEATDEYGQSGIKEYRYVLMDGLWKWEETTSDVTHTFTNLVQGKTYTIKVTAIDNAGNEKEGNYLETDTEGPTIVVTGNPTEWTSQSVKLQISISDISGVSQVVINGEEQRIVDGTYEYRVYNNGEYTIVATDEKGNTTSKTVTVDKIDMEAPTITFSKESNSTELKTQEVTVTVTETGSGKNTYKYLWSKSEYTSSNEEDYTDGEFSDGDTISKKGLAGDYYLHVYMKDNVGNEATVRTQGTFNFRYEISNEEELIQFYEDTNSEDLEINYFEGETVYVVNDITVSSSTELNPGGFSGTLEGGNHTISGLNIIGQDLPTGQYCYGGLFAALNETGTIRNIGIIDSTVRCDNIEYLGGLVGVNYGKIENCWFQGNVTGSSFGMGGIAGVSWNECTISKCHTEPNTSITNNSGTGMSNGGTGGIIGRNWGKINNCYNYATITGETCGGIIGRNSSSSDNEIKNCYNRGTVRGNGIAGGIIGKADEQYAITKITSCYNAGSIKADGEVGGIVGYAMGHSTTAYPLIKNTYNLGNLSHYTNSTECNIGGICGTVRECFEVSNSYNEGNIGSGNYVGGIIGYNIDGDASSSGGERVVSNCKYKQGTATNGFGWTGNPNNQWVAEACDISGQAEVSSSLPTILSVIGSGFKSGSDGYPVLTWQ